MQTYLSEVWTGHGGELAVFYHNSTQTDIYNNVYVLGSTVNSNNNHDIMLQKFSQDGTLLWQETHDGQANLDDMGAKLFIDDNFNIYITGTITNDTTDNLDLAVIKYDSSGAMLWEYTYDNPNVTGSRDVGIDITGDNQGSIFVTGGSDDANFSSDYITIRLNSSNGDKIWDKRYDNVQLDDVSSVIELRDTTVVVSGGSQISSARWGVAAISYSVNNGANQNEYLSSGSATTGVDEINDITTDNSGNFYLTGAVNNQGSGYDIALYKLNSQLVLQWEEHFDSENLNDKGNGVKVDNQGNIIVAGYTSTIEEGENYIILKYDSNGSLIWGKEYNSEFNGDDRANQLVINNQDEIFATGFSMNQNNKDYLTLGIDTNGELFSDAIYNGVSNLDDEPKNIAIDLDGNLIVVGQSEYQNGVLRNQTVKYSIIERELNILTTPNDVSYLDNNLIIRFDKSKLIHSAINKKGFIAGDLRDFVKSEFITEMNELTDFDWDRQSTYKIHKRATIADSLSTTRQGDIIQLPDFWASLIVEIPDGYDEQVMADSIDTIFGIHRAQLEHVYLPTDVPTDVFYIDGYQLGLHPNSTYPDADIDVEGAWGIIDNAGSKKGDNNVKVGIYDHLIDYSHTEFGSSGNLATSKIRGGRNYHQQGSGSLDISYANTLVNSHGTKVAGIIGAHRNEGAGIAGGDLFDNPFNNDGVQLYSLGIHYQNMTATSSIVAEALIEGSSNTNTNYGYGLELANHSYAKQGAPDIEVLNGIKTSWKNGTINIASRGKSGDANLLEFPACFGDKYLINVIASGEDGDRMNGSNGPGDWESPYGIENVGNTQACYVDVMAPGVASLISTSSNQYDSSNPLTGCLVPTQQNGSNYSCFNGTSAAAPHVTGVAALMYSSHDPNYHWDYKNTLAIEDIEHILEKTTFDSPNPYDVESGYGLVDAREAVKQVTRPYTVRHKHYWGSQSSLLFEGFIDDGFTGGVYLDNFEEDYGIQHHTKVDVVKKYRLNFTVDYIPTSGNEIIDWWKLSSARSGGASSKGLTATTITNMSFDNDYWSESISVDYNINEVNGHVSTWCYKIYTNWPTSYIWYPMNPNYIHYTYALHLKADHNGLSNNDKNEDKIRLYPNPTGGNFNVSWEDQITVDQISITDSKGSLIRMNEHIQGSNIKIDISDLENGIYFVRITSEKAIINKKIIKN
ncbi:MAG: S8 family serine peptidase [Brumimicrobium sp.]